MNTAVKHKVPAYRRVILERLLLSYQLHRQTIFWSLHFLLASVLLLVSLSPSASGITRAISLFGLMILGAICFLNHQQQTISQHPKEDSLPAAVKRTNTKPIVQGKKRTQNAFQPLNIHQIVLEVNALMEKKSIHRKTIEFFMLPTAQGKREATKAIDQLKAAGYAIRLHTEENMPGGVPEHGQNLIGESNGHVQIFIAV